MEGPRKERGSEQRHQHVWVTARELKAFKGKYREVLKDTPGRACLVSHSIPMEDAPPVRLPPYQLAHKSLEVLRDKIKSFLNQGKSDRLLAPGLPQLYLSPRKITPKECV